MKKNTLITLVIVLLLISCSKEAEYPAKITTVEGVKQVTNPDYPKEGNFTLDLKEIYTLGTEDVKSQYFFAHPFMLNIDSKENLYVLDWQQNTIFMFNPDGKYRKNIGRKGNGPGDFDTPVYFGVSADDHLIINDARNLRVCRLDTNGKYISGFSFKSYLDDIVIDKSGLLYFIYQDIKESKLSSELQEFPHTNFLIRTDITGTTFDTVKAFNGEKYRMMKIGNGMTMVGPFNPFSWIVTDDNHLITHFGEVYDISKMDLKGDLKLKFGREYRKILNEEQTKRQSKNVYFNVFGRYSVSDDKGNYWANLDIGRDKDYYLYDIFSSEGIYLKQVKVPGKIKLIKGNEMYLVTEDESGMPLVKRSKYSFKSNKVTK